MSAFVAVQMSSACTIVLSKDNDESDDTDNNASTNPQIAMRTQVSSEMASDASLGQISHDESEEYEQRGILMRNILVCSRRLPKGKRIKMSNAKEDTEDATSHAGLMHLDTITTSIHQDVAQRHTPGSARSNAHDTFKTPLPSVSDVQNSNTPFGAPASDGQSSAVANKALTPGPHDTLSSPEASTNRTRYREDHGGPR
ncbi:hypothetical protein SUNI508_05476 [Seiridium unicorne]|uniref:Uncharacterized protein n=1 Tax=Seiridium unicorne TaxID=138068 RepID=A0ABR2V5X6_9PEZI